MTKLGRNEPCHCGSGQQYKHCHLNPDRQTERGPVATRLPREPFTEGVLTGRPFIDAGHQGYRFRAVGGRLYYGPLDESFHEFVLRLLREQITHEWMQKELAKAPSDQHLIVRWFLEKDDLLASRADDHGKGVRSVVMTGGVKALLALGHDIYSLLHTGEILPRLVNRLKDRDPTTIAGLRCALASFMRSSVSFRRSCRPFRRGPWSSATRLFPIRETLTTMTDTCWIALLAGTGGVMELAGLFVVVREIQKDRQAASDLLKEDAVVRPLTIEATTQVFTPSVHGGDEPTLDERVSTLEKAYQEKFRLLEETTRATKAELRSIIAEEAAELARQDKERDRALRRFLHTQITGSLRQRVWGVVLIGLGIACATVAGVWGTLS